MWGSAVQVCPGLRLSGGLAQPARAPALQAGGRRFESVILHQARRGEKRGREKKKFRAARCRMRLRPPFRARSSVTNWRGQSKSTRARIHTNEKHERSYLGRTGDALALRGEEGRDKLRKAAGRRKWPVIRGCPNGATQPARAIRKEANPGN